ncbi:MAG TPA: hydrogenase maturation protease [Candidatus Sulfopaludibacter sp.]|jgi:hydrogenase maturation protease|nr:hydrogenase maturation protease [Candidatus Sulfopaludibacter sp.]
MSGTLVAGVGNIFFGDDAFGSEAARRLQREKWPEGVRVIDFGIRGLDLTYALLDGYDTVILLDASPRGGAPGTLYTIEPDLTDLPAGEVETHGMEPLRVLAVARSMGAEWKRLLVVACEPTPGSADPDGPGSMEMTEAVQWAVEETVDVVRSLLCESISANSAK